MNDEHDDFARVRPMPFGIRVCALAELGAVAKENRATAVISALDPGTRAPRPEGVSPEKHLELFFEDVSLEDARGAPKINDVKRALDFVAKLDPDDVLVIHCHAGISRSAAIAFLVAAREFGDAKAALESLVAIRRLALPNLLIAAHGSKLLGDESMLSVVEDFHKREFGGFII
jgi:predicted protein tyrosine phosphatase